MTKVFFKNKEQEGHVHPMKHEKNLLQQNDGLRQGTRYKYNLRDWAF